MDDVKETSKDNDGQRRETRRASIPNEEPLKDDSKQEEIEQIYPPNQALEETKEKRKSSFSKDNNPDNLKKERKKKKASLASDNLESTTPNDAKDKPSTKTDQENEDISSNTVDNSIRRSIGKKERRSNNSQTNILVQEAINDSSQGENTQKRKKRLSKDIADLDENKEFQRMIGVNQDAEQEKESMKPEQDNDIPVEVAGKDKRQSDVDKPRGSTGSSRKEKKEAKKASIQEEKPLNDSVENDGKEAGEEGQVQANLIEQDNNPVNDMSTGEADNDKRESSGSGRPRGTKKEKKESRKANIEKEEPSIETEPMNVDQINDIIFENLEESQNDEKAVAEESPVKATRWIEQDNIPVNEKVKKNASGYDKRKSVGVTPRATGKNDGKKNVKASAPAPNEDNAELESNSVMTDPKSDKAPSSSGDSKTRKKKVVAAEKEEASFPDGMTAVGYYEEMRDPEQEELSRPESQQALVPSEPIPEKDLVYRVIVKVPRVTKSYYDRVGDGKQDIHHRNGYSDSDIHRRHRKIKADTYKQPASRQNLHPTPAAGSTNLMGRKVKPDLPQKKTKPREKMEGEILNYFDPDMVQFEYQNLLPKSRNIVIGPPSEILQTYFGYGKKDPLPPELQHDRSPKAFILPKHLWKEYDDTKSRLKFNDSVDKFGKGKKKSRSTSKSPSRRNVASPSSTNLKKGRRKGGKQPMSTPSPLDLFSRPKKKGRGDERGKRGGDVSVGEQVELEKEEKPIVFPNDEEEVNDEGDPRYYEKTRTKCERRRRREIDDDELREKEHEYQVICGSEPSSTSVMNMENIEVAPPKPKKRLSGVDSAPVIPESNKPSPKVPRQRSSWPNFTDREGSDISIEFGPDPMRRIPRDEPPEQFKYYRSYPLYPTLSNETFYEWYPDLHRLEDPFAPKKYLRPAGVSKSSPITDMVRPKPVKQQSPPPMQTTVPNTQPETRESSKPERPDYDTKDYVYDNARSVMIMPPKKPVPRYVDDRNGTTHLLEPSGLMHKYVRKEDFAKLPEYLVDRNEEQGRPPVPDFDKFYRFHRCKFIHGHVHCKHCNTAHNLHTGSGDWDCCENSCTGCEKYYSHLCEHDGVKCCLKPSAEERLRSSREENCRPHLPHVDSQINYIRNPNKNPYKINNNLGGKDQMNSFKGEVEVEEQLANDSQNPLTKDVQLIVNMMNELAVENDMKEIMAKYTFSKPKKKSSTNNYFNDNGNYWQSSQLQNFDILNSPLNNNNNPSYSSVSHNTGTFSFRPVSNVNVHYYNYQ